MKTLRWTIGTGALALLIVSCSNSQGTNGVAQTSPAPTAPAIAPSPSPQAVPLPVVPVQSKRLPVPGLIQPTNARERVAQLVPGRNDPFDPIATPAIVVPPPVTPINPARTVQPPDVSLLPEQPEPDEIARSETSPLTAPLKVNVPSLPSIETIQLPTAVAPAAPNVASLPGLLPGAPGASTFTSLASAVEVSGVLQTGNSFSAILKAPEEKTDRYVVVGEFLSNGKVMVKRIDIDASGEPVVVLEENGLEVMKSVGRGSNSLAGNF